jgi:hypothetical protein
VLAAALSGSANLTVALTHGHPLDSPRKPGSPLHSLIVAFGCNHFRFHRLTGQRRNRINGSRVRSRAV